MNPGVDPDRRAAPGAKPSAPIRVGGVRPRTWYGPAVDGVERAWLPLGSAHIIDWKHLNQATAPRGSTAWVISLRSGDPVLVRTWCEETTTYFEFWVLTYEALTGRAAVRVQRPEANRIHVSLDLEVTPQLRYTETSEFVEHPRTGLPGSVVREVEVQEGSFDAVGNPSLTPAQAEIFEYSPESALHTDCGDWLAQVLERVRAFVIDGAHESGEPALEAAPAPRPSVPEPTPEPPRRADPPRVVVPAPPEPSPRRPEPDAQRRPERRPEPEPEPTPVPVAAPALPRLFAATNGGDSWEIVDDETYIGRSKQCAVVLKSQRVSRKHASVTREGDGWYINDLGAANGIWAGSDKVERELIKDEAEYIIGDVLLTFTFS